MNYPRYRLASTLKFYLKLFYGLFVGKFLHDQQVQKLEAELKKLTNQNYLLALPQARIGLYLFLKNTISPGDEVIISSYTLIDMVNMIICAGGKPVFCDVEAGHYILCVKDLQKKISPRTKVVIVSHLYGIASPLEDILTLCRQNNLLLFEDCAQSFATIQNGHWTGTQGDAAVYSFGALKNINGLLGGALLVKEKSIFKKCRDELQSSPLLAPSRILSKVGFSLFYEVISHPVVYSAFLAPIISMFDKKGHIDKEAQLKKTLPQGLFCRMTSLQADLILDNLKHLFPWADKSQQIVQFYEQILDEKKNDSVKKFPKPQESHNIYLQYPIWVEESNLALKKFLRKKKIDINIDFFRNVAELECFKDYGVSCPQTQRLISHLALLPSYPRQSLKYTRKIARALKEF